jgi:alanine racemase
MDYMKLQNVYQVLSNQEFKNNEISDNLILKLNNTLSKFSFSPDDINSIYDFVYNNNLDPVTLKYIREHFPITEERLHNSVFIEFNYFKALCQYSNIDLSFNKNSLLFHFLLSMDLEEAEFIFSFKSVRDNFDKEYFLENIDEDIINKFIFIKNINQF